MTLKEALTAINCVPDVYMYNNKTNQIVTFAPPYSDAVLKLKVDEIYTDCGIDIVLKWNKKLAD
ncbi:MAG: hypothetical protein J5662_07170 [Clostridia bacterium]|nr:hypothetical protein [Clostridia bacterium]